MNLQRMMALVRKDLKKTVREPAMLFLIVLFPIMLTLFFGLAFGAVGGGDTGTYDIGIVDLNDHGPGHNWSDSLISNLAGTKLLTIRNYTLFDEAKENLSSGSLQAIIVIPENFGASCDSFVGNRTSPDNWVNSTILLSLDKGSLIATQAIPPILDSSLAKTLRGDSIIQSTPISIGIPSLVDVNRQSTFDFMVPGLFAYGAIFFTMTVGQSLTVEREEGLLRRMNTTPLTATEFMMSQAVTNMLLAALQVALIFLIAFALGYSPSTNATGLVMSFAIVMVFALCCVGFGLITATISRSAGAATGIAFVFIMPQMFLGTFVSASLSGVAADIEKFVPSHYVTDALTNLFLRGLPITNANVLMDFLVICATSVLILIAGILLWRKYGKS